ncbi:QDE-2-interacting protein [Fusarium subglutinans]|uniref:QDE-2-interacting protein n=1 Tax=Gibberella subglutinans TaxID=42677 RepID=A0A8H5VAP3_GIBSU|nr:QDE-2-interacting protein [Fusarium subglutinans]KAF5614359.1 QDE-2-interacting protein [Fusarium subglutinans]
MRPSSKPLQPKPSSEAKPLQPTRFTFVPVSEWAPERAPLHESQKNKTGRSPREKQTPKRPQISKPEDEPEPEPGSERKTQEPTEINLQQDKPEFDKRYLIANLKEEEAKFRATRASMTRAERKKAWNDLAGFSLETPYSRKLYGKPQDFRLARRLRATELIRMVFGYQLTARLKKEMESRVPNRLRGSNMRDVRLICVDTDKAKKMPGEPSKTESFHLGVAILDTRDLRDVIRHGFKLDNPSDLIRTYQFVVQDSVPKVDHFCFGDTEAISVGDLRRRFVEWQGGRDVIGVAYSAHSDLAILKEFNIILSTIFWIDLALAQYIPFQEATAPSLAVVMNRLRIRYAGKLHEPGNDAHFTMRTLLGLAVLDFWREWTYWEDGLSAIPSWYGLATKIIRAETPRPERHFSMD